jgi:hypothetical protein
MLILLCIKDATSVVSYVLCWIHRILSEFFFFGVNYVHNFCNGFGDNHFYRRSKISYCVLVSCDVVVF